MEKPVEDLKFVTAKGRYVDDIKLEGMLRLNILRSTHAHARIKQIDLSEIERRGNLTIKSSDIAKVFKETLPAVVLPNVKIVRQPVLASNKANFVGQPVAAFVSRNQYIGEDLSELASIDYEPCEPVVDPYKAMEPSSPIVHENIGSNVNLSTVIGQGDIDHAFSKADVIVEDKLSTHRVAPNPIEPRGVIVSWDGSRFTITIASQSAFAIREGFKETLGGINNDQVRIVQTDVGGAFGSKGAVYPEYILACYAAMRLRRPIKWIETRSEHLIGTHQGRDVRAEISLAARSNGEILGLKARVLADIGAYNFHVGTRYGPFVAEQLSGPYRVPSASVEVLHVFTNKAPIGPYRGAGRPEAAFFYERMMDLLADELSIDQSEIRLRNLIASGEMPYTSSTGLRLSPEDYISIANKSLDYFDYEKLKEQFVEKNSGSRTVGLGLATYIEVSKTGPGETALARLEADGSFTLISGLGPQGQGHTTMIRNLLATELGVAKDRIKVVFGDSDLMPSGFGTFGSRSASVGGAAAVRAARKLIDRMIEAASSVLEIDKSKLYYSSGEIRRRDYQEFHLPLEKLASSMVEGKLQCFDYYETGDVSAFGVHMALAEVDSGSGMVKVLGYNALDDAGKVIDEVSAESQIAGGVMQGISEVLYEQVVYNEEGQPAVGTIGDAGVPSACESISPRSVFVEFPSSFIHGARGIGEAGAIGAVPSLVRAVEVALRKEKGERNKNVRIRSTSLAPELVYGLLS